jgi:hypothetical protein
MPPFDGFPMDARVRKLIEVLWFEMMLLLWNRKVKGWRWDLEDSNGPWALLDSANRVE